MSVEESKWIVVECGARRQKFRFDDRSNLKRRICEYFDVKSEISFQMFNYDLNQYETIENFERIEEDLRCFHRFRIVKYFDNPLLLANLQTTMHKLVHAVKHIDQIQNIIGVLNYNCNILDHIIDYPPTYLVDPSSIEKSAEMAEEEEEDDNNIDSVSTYDPPKTFNQTCLIPCKYAVRGNCPSGEKCPYSHNETSIQFEREWQRRL